MLKVTCFNCHWSWSLNAEAAQAAYDSLEPGEKHYNADCPHCGRANKVSVKQLERALPRATPSAGDEGEAQG